MTTELYHIICEYLQSIVTDTPWDGHIFAVGGCCRDEIMDMPIKDLDVAVNLPDGGIKFAIWLMEQGHLLNDPVLFKQYGTAKIELSKFPGEEIELVQTRKEKYTDRNSRNPETAFGSLHDDCIRRDLTINSLYFDIKKKTYIDLTGKGISDIQNRIIRTPADPNTTYDDDPVRILRCIRFAAKFGWEIEGNTYEALKSNVDRLKIVSVERIRGEFEKMLTCDNPTRALMMLKDTGAMKYIIPEICKTFALEQNKYQLGTVWEHTLKVVEGVPADYVLRLSALLHDIGKIRTKSTDESGTIHFYGHEKAHRIIVNILHRLHYHSDMVKKVSFLVENHTALKRWGDAPEDRWLPDIRRLQYKSITPIRFNNLMSLIHADNMAMASGHCRPLQVGNVMKLSERLVAERTDFFNYSLPLSMADIVKIKNLKSEDKAIQYYNKLINLACKNPGIKKTDLKNYLLNGKETENSPKRSPKQRKNYYRKNRSKSKTKSRQDD